MEVTVTLHTNKEYADDLKRRMKKAGISQNQLADEMGKSPTQVSRWFTKTEARRVQPELQTVQEIEAAIKRIVARRERAAKRATGSADMNE
jgi:transcriptional regulator with XRE-family HTH domain